MNDPLRVLVVDDERLAREGVLGLLEAEPDVEVAGECANGRAAVDALRRGGVDIVLLDIQMPGMDGFQVLRAVPEADLPVVVFLTAYDQYALRAFDASALDYLVKPFSDARFATAMDRARRQVRQRRKGKAGEDLANLVALLRSDDGAGGTAAPGATGDKASRHRFVDRIAVRSVGRVAYVRVADIIWIGAADYYVELHTRDGKSHLVRETMQRIEDRLDPARFVRIHRSAIVSLDQVAELRTDSAERQYVVLRGGTKLPLGKSRREHLERMLAER